LVALSPEEYEPVMLFINHSCDPNVGFAGNIVLVAMCDVSAGEELTTDYALFDDYDEDMACHCNTAQCRRVIGGRDWRRSELQRRYHGYFSWYLQEKIAATYGEANPINGRHQARWRGFEGQVNGPHKRLSWRPQPGRAAVMTA
jgi:uncharacterized protein